MEAHSPRNV